MALLHFAALVHREVLCVGITAAAFSKERERNYSTSVKHQTNNLLLAQAFRFMTRHGALIREKQLCTDYGSNGDQLRKFRAVSRC